VIEDDLHRDLARIDGDLVALRRDLHEHPELSYAETRTAALVADRARALGLAVRTGVGGTGVVADLQGEAPGPTLLIRADMDALPVAETSGFSFASKNPGVMHACGHDAHVASVLGAATLLADRRRHLAGRVRFIFQPAEEVSGGAARMIEDGVLEGVDRVLGAHVLAPVPVGVIAVRPGPFMAAIDAFEITVTGKAGHGAMPQLSIDPIYAAAQVVVALQSIVARETRPGEPVVVGITSIEGGRAANVIVEQVVLRGTIRTFSAEDRTRVLDRVPAIARGVCEALRARAEMRILFAAPVTRNAPDPAESIRRAAEATGRAVAVDPGPITASEDFSYFLEKVPGCFFGVGAGGPDAAPHHHHAFTIDERAIGLASEVFVRAALDMLAPAAAP
jgi:amidohydrolase